MALAYVLHQARENRVENAARNCARNYDSLEVHRREPGRLQPNGDGSGNESFRVIERGLVILGMFSRFVDQADRVIKEVKGPDFGCCGVLTGRRENVACVVGPSVNGSRNRLCSWSTHRFN